MRRVTVAEMFTSYPGPDRSWSLDQRLYLACFALGWLLTVAVIADALSFAAALAVEVCAETICVLVAVVHRKRHRWRWPGMTWIRVLRLVGMLVAVPGVVWLMLWALNYEKARPLGVFIGLVMQPIWLYLLLWAPGFACQYRAEFVENCQKKQRREAGELTAVPSGSAGGPSSTPTQKVRMLRLILGLSFLVIGVGSWLAGALIVTGTWVPAEQTELPLSGLCDIAITPTGTIYCAVPWYARIQMYDADGEFLRGWHVDAGGGIFDVQPTAQGKLQAATLRNDRLYTFDPTGRLLSQDAAAPGTQPLDGSGEGGDAEGNRYRRATPFFWPRAVRTGPDGTSRTLIASPFLLWLVSWPFPAVAWLAAGLGLVAISGGPRKLIRAFGRA